MKDVKEVAMDVMNGDKKAKLEMEKMMGKSFESMTRKERVLSVTMLAAFIGKW